MRNGLVSKVARLEAELAQARRELDALWPKVRAGETMGETMAATVQSLTAWRVRVSEDVRYYRRAAVFLGFNAVLAYWSGGALHFFGALVKLFAPA